MREEEMLVVQMGMLKTCLPKKYKPAIEELEKTYEIVSREFREEVRKANNQAIEWAADMIEGKPKYFRDGITKKLYKLASVVIVEPPEPDTKIIEFVIN